MLYAEDSSPNTAQGACPNCHGLGLVYEVTEKSMVPDDSLTIRERAIASWPPAWHGQNLRDILVTLGYDVDTPWRNLPKKDRNWILFTDETPVASVYAGFTPAETRAAVGRKMEPSYQGTFVGARNYVLHTFATTQSALMKTRTGIFDGDELVFDRVLKPSSRAATKWQTSLCTSTSRRYPRGWLRAKRAAEHRRSPSEDHIDQPVLIFDGDEHYAARGLRSLL